MGLLRFLSANAVGNTVHIKSKNLVKKKDRKMRSKNLKLVTPQGLEPQLTVPKTVVLPLHHGVINKSILRTDEMCGYPTRTRTSTNGTKNRCATITPWGSFLRYGGYNS